MAETIKRKRFLVAILFAGVLLLVTGISLWLYTDSVITGHKQRLDDPNLTLEQKWQWEGSLQWWKTAKTTTFNPASIILITIGLCTLEYAIIYVIAHFE